MSNIRFQYGDGRRPECERLYGPGLAAIIYAGPPRKVVRNQVSIGDHFKENSK